MRWRKANFKTWEEIRKELPKILVKIDTGETYWWDLHQAFDDKHDYALVLGFDDEEELSLMIAYESKDSYMHEYYWDWLMPVTEGDVWDTQVRLSVKDAARIEFIRNTLDWFQEQWLSMKAYFTRKKLLNEIAMNYKPEPINTDSVELPEEITELTEKLAKSTHDTWAQNRLNQGWTYGEKRDDDKKLHPCLIPYEDLPESEKKYDRDTAMETLKAIYALGYRITK